MYVNKLGSEESVLVSSLRRCSTCISEDASLSEVNVD
jgi:hypothetical protein